MQIQSELDPHGQHSLHPQTVGVGQQQGAIGMQDAPDQSQIMPTQRWPDHSNHGTGVVCLDQQPAASLSISVPGTEMQTCLNSDTTCALDGALRPDAVSIGETMPVANSCDEASAPEVTDMSQYAQVTLPINDSEQMQLAVPPEMNPYLQDAPEGWSIHFAQSTIPGTNELAWLPYYWHEASGLSSWEYPDEELIARAAQYEGQAESSGEEDGDNDDDDGEMQIL